jgi:hypothetical protein
MASDLQTGTGLIGLTKSYLGMHICLKTWMASSSQWRLTVNISRSTSRVCGMVSSKAGATHQAVNRYDQLARTRESRRGAEGYEPTEPYDSYRRKIEICARASTRKEGRYMQWPTYIKEKEKYFVPNTSSRSGSRCITIDFRILKINTCRFI